MVIVWCDGNIWPSRVVRDEFLWVELALMLMQQQPYELDLAMLAAHLNDGRRVLHAGWILLMAMPINEETCKYKCVNGITMLHKLSEHCAYAHMRMWAYALRWRRTYQALPSGEMDGYGYRMKERTMTVETEPLLARIFGWWAMFLLFSRIGFYYDDWLCYGLLWVCLATSGIKGEE
jgi:hypothetical protein